MKKSNLYSKKWRMYERFKKVAAGTYKSKAQTSLMAGFNLLLNKVKKENAKRVANGQEKVTLDVKRVVNLVKNFRKRQKLTQSEAYENAILKQFEERYTDPGVAGSAYEFLNRKTNGQKMTGAEILESATNTWLIQNNRIMSSATARDLLYGRPPLEAVVKKYFPQFIITDITVKNYRQLMTVGWEYTLSVKLEKVEHGRHISKNELFTLTVEYVTRNGHSELIYTAEKI